MLLTALPKKVVSFFFEEGSSLIVGLRVGEYRDYQRGSHVDLLLFGSWFFIRTWPCTRSAEDVVGFLRALISTKRFLL